MTTATQLSFLPDNDQPEPAVKRTSVPLIKWIDGHWCWLKFGTQDYQREPELEAILLAAQHEQRRAA